MFGQPALSPGHGATESEGQTFLAEQRVAAIPGPEAEDLQRVGLVGDDQLVGVAGPLDLQQIDVRLCHGTEVLTNLRNTRMEGITNAVKTLNSVNIVKHICVQRMTGGIF